MSITVTQEETIVRQRTYSRLTIISILTDELDEPEYTSEELAKLSDAELATKIQTHLDDRDEVFDVFNEGYYEPYEVDSSYEFTVEVKQ